MAKESSDPAEARPSRRSTWRRFKKNRGATVGLCLIGLLIFVALFAPVLAPHSPDALDLQTVCSPPSRDHWLGTDELGRDVLSRLIHGSRIVVVVAISATAVATAVGVVLGLVAGYYGGWVDTIIMRALDVLLAFPGFLLAIALVAFLGANTLNIVVVVGLTRIPRYARLIRGTVLSVREIEYVQASKAVGSPEIRTMLLHVLPNCIGPTLVYASLTFGDSILTISGLSFLGIGVQPPTADWGSMLSRGREYLMVAPWLAVCPGAAIFVTVMAINLTGDGLRDALDPRG